jgi:pimeloyl-ACP methyl ester carboxylesterase
MDSPPTAEFLRPPARAIRVPTAGENNLCYLDRDTDTVIVFVHGILSDSRSCWLHQGLPSVYSPEMVSRDTRFDDCSLYLGGYHSDIDAGRYKVRDRADELLRALGRAELPGQRSVLDRQAILFICHSMGGIVTRSMLDRHTSKFEDKSLGLLLIASPSTGSAWATRAQFLTDLYGHEQGRQLEWGGDTLDDLDQRFHQLLREGTLPHLYGAEAYENHFVIHRRWLPNRMVIVDIRSAERYFAPARLLRKTDHSTCVKPDGPRHPAHELLVDVHSDWKVHRTRELEQRFGASVAGPPSAEVLGPNRSMRSVVDTAPHDVLATYSPHFFWRFAGAEPVLDGAAADPQQVSYLFRRQESRQWLRVLHAASASASRT